MAKTLEELRQEYPDLVGQIEANAKAEAAQAAASAPPAAPAAPATPAAQETTPPPGAGAQKPQGEGIDPIQAAVQQEQNRLKEIDEISASVQDPELIQKAKYGPEACTAQELAFRALSAQAKAGAAHLTAMQKDYTDSGASGVSVPQATPTTGMGAKETPEQIEAQAKAAAEAFIKATGGN